MATEAELEKLARENLDPGTPVWVAHFFHHFHSTQAERRGFHQAMIAAGFGNGGMTGCLEENDGDGYWHHYFYTRVEADPEVLRRRDGFARQIATEHRVLYSSWEVTRDVRTGRVRDMTEYFEGWDDPVTEGWDDPVTGI